jgi:hypothetical protein
MHHALLPAELCLTQGIKPIEILIPWEQGVTDNQMESIALG